MLPEGVRHIVGDRTDREAFVQAFEQERFDVVFDMICFTPEQAEDSVRAFRGRCEQFVFCSTAATYGAKVPPHVLIDEQFPLEPVSDYGRSKVACEITFRRAAESGAFAVTICAPPTRTALAARWTISRSPTAAPGIVWPVACPCSSPATASASGNRPTATTARFSSRTWR